MHAGEHVSAAESGRPPTRLTHFVPARRCDRQIWEDLTRLIAPQGNFAVYRQMLKTAAYVVVASHAQPPEVHRLPSLTA